MARPGVSERRPLRYGGRLCFATSCCAPWHMPKPPATATP